MSEGETTNNCTCADHGAFITTDQRCPMHGVAEIERRIRRARAVAGPGRTPAAHRPADGLEQARQGVDRLRAVFFEDDDGHGWWQLAIVQPGGFVQLVRSPQGPMRYPNGQQHLMQAIAAGYGWPVIEFDAGPYSLESLIHLNEVWG